jgi:hypothetical protein
LEARVALHALASVALIGAGASATPILPAQTAYSVSLTGAAQVGAIDPSGSRGDIDGSGQVKLIIDPQRKQICYDFTLAGLSTPLMAHIHKGPASRNGPSVVTLFTGPEGDLDDCVMWTRHRLAEIVANAPNFYVNLYTTEFPDGALRGQLPG